MLEGWEAYRRWLANARPQMPRLVMPAHRYLEAASRYERAGRPFGGSMSGFMLWVRHDTEVTTN
ncbi:MAG: hypothetical protein AAGI71_16410 [Bacteroidota bacterium]